MIQVLLSVHVFNSVAYYASNNDHPFMLYHACMKPDSFHESSIFIFKLDFILLMIYNIITIMGNFYLFFFLKNQTENNTALNSVDRKKERKRNFVNAKSGIICAFALLLNTAFYSIFYGLKVANMVFLHNAILVNKSA